jgi:hypothetical protein
MLQRNLVLTQTKQILQVPQREKSRNLPLTLAIDIPEKRAIAICHKCKRLKALLLSLITIQFADF